MYKYKVVTYKIGMTILNLKVKDFNWLVEFKQVYALDSCGIPILSVNDIVRCKIRCIYPTSALNLEGVSLGTLNNLAVDVKLNKPINLVYSSRDNFLFSRFTSDMINAGNCIADLNGFYSLLAECGENRGTRYKAEHRVAHHRCGCSRESSAYHSGDHSVGSPLKGINHLNYTTKDILCQEKTPHLFPSAEKKPFNYNAVLSV